MLKVRFLIDESGPILITDSNKFLKSVNYQDVKQFSSKGSKERVSISDTNNTIWFHILDDNTVIGCCGLYLAKKKCRIKGDWITPKYRGKGYGEFITQCRLLIARKFNYNLIEVLTLHPKYYEKKGFTINKEIRKGVWHGDRVL